MSDGVKFTGDWQKAIKLLREAPKRIERALNAQLLQEAHRVRADIVRSIDAGGKPRFASHSPTTIAIRRFMGMRSGKVLVQSAALRNSIVAVLVRPGLALVGVRRRAKSGVDLAHIHEFGRTWTQVMTPRMRRFLMAALGSVRGRTSQRGTGKATITIRIPARPYIRPAAQRINAAAMQRRFERAIQAALK